jgi:REP element-mobilizing transposase RayT
MARPLRIQYPGAFYHVTSRGNERKKVFKSQRDREKFLEYFQSSTQRYDAVIHAYCLMDNHHLILETPSGNLSQIMQHINGAYTTYFNVKRRRSGHLFQGRYKAILIDADEYAKELSSYIHLNPVRAKIVELPEEYKWSSYNFYIGSKKTPKWLTRDFILGYFSEKVYAAEKKYRKYVKTLVNEEYQSPFEEVFASSMLGGLDFINDIKEAFLKDKKEDRELPSLNEISDKPGIDEIIKKTNEVLSHDNALSKKVAIYLCHNYSRKKLKEIGSDFGISESGVTQASRRLSMVIEKDRKLKKMISKIKTKLHLSKV